MLNRQDMLVGRALLWEGVIKHDNLSSIKVGPFKIMDRIYTINDESYMFHFRKWADDNEFFYKKDQKWNSTVFLISKDIEHIMKLSLSLDKTDLRRFPYMDTFKFICFENNTIYNYKPAGVRVKTISLANGSYENSEFLELDGYNNLYDYRVNMVWVNYKKYWTSTNHVRHSGINDCYILKEDAIMNNDLGEYIFIDNSLNNMEVINHKLEQIRKYREEREERLNRQREEMRLRMEAREREAAMEREARRSQETVQTQIRHNSERIPEREYGWPEEWDMYDSHIGSFSRRGGYGRFDRYIDRRLFSVAEDPIDPIDPIPTATAA